MEKLSALVLTKNEEENIEACLNSINWIEEIVVVDSLSEDNTKEICLDFDNVIFYEREFDDFASQRNYGLEKISNPWVFVIDADERCTPELREEIEQELENPNAEGFEMPRKNYFLGKWIKYCGWYPDLSLQVFKSKYRYKGVVHESPNINKEIKRLRSDLLHYTYKDLKNYLDKMNHYAILNAEKSYANNKKTNGLYILIRPVFEFVYNYVFRRGFLLGTQGIILSFVMAYYSFLKYAKLWEKNFYEKKENIND